MDAPTMNSVTEGANSISIEKYVAIPVFRR